MTSVSIATVHMAVVYCTLDTVLNCRAGVYFEHLKLCCEVFPAGIYLKL